MQQALHRHGKKGDEKGENPSHHAQNKRKHDKQGGKPLLVVFKTKENTMRRVFSLLIAFVIFTGWMGSSRGEWGCSQLAAAVGVGGAC